MIAAKSLEASAPAADDGDLVTSQYAGKESLRPIYEAIIEAIGQLGNDIEVAPKKTYVSLRRGKQFAIVQPSTKTRVDVGLNLKSTKATKRLEESGSFNKMVSHRVRLSSVDDVDSQLSGWLKKAYTEAG